MQFLQKVIIVFVYLFTVSRRSDNIYPSLWHLHKSPSHKQNENERGCKNAHDKIPGLSAMITATIKEAVFQITEGSQVKNPTEKACFLTWQNEG